MQVAKLCPGLHITMHPAHELGEDTAQLNYLHEHAWLAHRRASLLHFAPSLRPLVHCAPSDLLHAGLPHAVERNFGTANEGQPYAGVHGGLTYIMHAIFRGGEVHTTHYIQRDRWYLHTLRRCMVVAQCVGVPSLRKRVGIWPQARR